MKFKAIWKDTFREISKSLMRFLAILIIIFLGVGFYVGISATSPDMMLTADKYFTDLNLMDYKVLSTYGLTEADIEELQKAHGVPVQSHYAYDFALADTYAAIRLYSYDLENGQNINQYYVIDGRLPEKAGEIALDNKLAYSQSVEIGETISLSQGENSGEPEKHLKRLEFEVVGFVNSPMFVENIARGMTSIGSGTLGGFGVIPAEDYDAKYFTEAYLKIDSSPDFAAYSDDYDDFVKSFTPELEKTLSLLEDRRSEVIKAEIEEEIADGWAEIEKAERELADAQAEIEDARSELSKGWVEFEDGRRELQEQTQSATAEIAQNEQRLTGGLAEATANERELRNQAANLQNERANLDQNEEQLLAGLAQVDDGIQQLEAGLGEIENQRPAAVAQVEQLSTQIQELEASRAQLEGMLQSPDVNPEEIEPQIAEIDANLAVLEGYRAEATAGLNELNVQRDNLLSQLNELENQRANLQSQHQQLLAGRQQIEEGLAQINAGLSQIETARAEIQQGFGDIEDAKSTLATETRSAEAELAEAEEELSDAEAEFEEGLATFRSERQKALTEIAEARADLEKAEEDLENLPLPDYLLFERADNPGYLEYKDNADRLAIIAKVFPGFFFLIAIFISFTTMTRMVDEEREYIGIMKAMGYENRQILIKFITYAALATTVGALLGLYAGYTWIPKLIFYAYSSMYNFPITVLEQFTRYTVIALLAAFISTVGASLLAVRYALRSNAAKLLQPKAPMKGTRIWLERITPIWKRLSFNHKITFRNVFRYKSRMFMTIFGIAGSTGLILTGFGISDSISDIPSVQYSEINQFQAYVAMDPNIEAGELVEYEGVTRANEEITDYLFITQENVTARAGGLNEQTLTFFVPSEPERLNSFVKLADFEAANEIYELDDSGAYVTQKFAQLFELEVGDSIEVENADNEMWTIKVAGILENYIGHTAYMTPDYYHEVTGNGIELPNVQLIKYDEETTDAEALGSQLMNEDEVVGINYVEDIFSSFSGTLNSLDLITQILVIAAAALAFIVLYNLTNINVSERKRELSTIKVLGSHDQEVTMYIYRENFILTFLGILVGLVFGTILTNFIMGTMEVDMLVFGREVHFSSYLYSTLLTILFTLVVMLVIHFQLKRIDMVEALKAND